eukprot:TRINITY_DN6974_c0_g1_i1.p1 TRINITY_DN6974_c0_g1~~TRINITY_DN6974_c0_g1_i1.p1  ORF type:complete len:445 (+),score=115.23 TRINITY_DN6974_c0_g1_i1:122-1456(+)
MSGRPRRHSTGSGLSPADEVCRFFGSRLMRRQFRIGSEEEDDAAAVQCRAEFNRKIEEAAAAEAAGVELHAPSWAVWCSEFSAKWEHVSSWVSPKHLRDTMTDVMGVLWGDVVLVDPALQEVPLTRQRAKDDKAPGRKAQPHECQVCRLKCNSIEQYKTHARGQRHLDRLVAMGLADDPPPPKPLHCLPLPPVGWTGGSAPAPQAAPIRAAGHPLLQAAAPTPSPAAALLRVGGAAAPPVPTPAPVPAAMPPGAPPVPAPVAPPAAAGGYDALFTAPVSPQPPHSLEHEVLFAAEPHHSDGGCFTPSGCTSPATLLSLPTTADRLDRASLARVSLEHILSRPGADQTFEIYKGAKRQEAKGKGDKATRTVDPTSLLADEWKTKMLRETLRQPGGHRRAHLSKERSIPVWRFDPYDFNAVVVSAAPTPRSTVCSVGPAADEHKEE